MQIRQPDELLASPKNVTITVLDCNNFFSLDYQPNSFSQAHHQLIDNKISHYQNKAPIIDRPWHGFKNLYRINEIKSYRNGNRSSIVNEQQQKNREGTALYVKSAQLQRKLMYTGKGGFHPYGRIRRVQQAIAIQKKNRVSAFGDRDKTDKLCDSNDVVIKKMTDQKLFNNAGLNIGLYNHTNNIIVGKQKYYGNCQTERISRGEQNEMLIKNITINPESIPQLNTISHQEQSIEHEIGDYSGLIGKKNSKTINSFSQNYKNRKKLLEKSTHRRSPMKQFSGSSNSPLRWDIKPEELAYTMNLEQRSKHWSPYAGKLTDRTYDPLLKSIQGNKIRYTHHEPKYFKGKLQQINKI